MEEKAGSDDKIWFIIAYLVPILTGIITYVLYASKDKQLKFHAVQSILYGIAIVVGYYVLVVIFFVLFFMIPATLFIPNLLILLAWLYGLYVGYKAFNGTTVMIPGVGEMAKKA